MAPASAAASGHHLQELGSLTHEKDLGGVMKNLSCSVGSSSCSTQSFHTTGEKMYLFSFELAITATAQIILSYWQEIAQSWEEAQQNPC